VSATHSLLIFTLDDEVFGMPAGCVVQVMELPETVPVPAVRTWFKGMAFFQAEPVPVIDLAGFHLRPGLPEVPAQVAMAVDSPMGVLILTVQRVDGIAELAETLELDRCQRPGSTRVTIADGRKVRVITPHELCRSKEFITPQSTPAIVSEPDTSALAQTV